MAARPPTGPLRWAAHPSRRMTNPPSPS